MKKLLYMSAALLLIFAVGLFWNKRKAPEPGQSFAAVTTANNGLTSKTGDELPDILSATNLEQWKSLIPDLKQNEELRDIWDTPRFRAGSPPVLIRQDSQSIVYKAEAIEVNVIPKTTDFMEARIYSPKMDIEETRALGTRLCTMFGFDSNKFSTWCDTVGNKWLDAPLFNIGDHRHFFKVLRSYNNQKPWYIIFAIQDENAVLKPRKR